MWEFLMKLCRSKTSIISNCMKIVHVNLEKDLFHLSSNLNFIFKVRRSKGPSILKKIHFWQWKLCKIKNNCIFPKMKKVKSMHETFTTKLHLAVYA